MNATSTPWPLTTVFPEMSLSAFLMAPWATFSPEAQAGAWSGVSANCQTVLEGEIYAEKTFR